MATDDKRLDHYDLLRILATFSVMLLHVAAGGVVTAYNIKSYEWNVCNFYDSFVRYSVPIFVMLSGTFFLDNSKPLPWPKVARKTFRLVTAYLFWAVCYSIVSVVARYGFTFDIHVLISFIGGLITGHYHLWFLFMIVGLYLVTPILREITKDRKLSWYFVILWFIFWGCTSYVVKIPIYGKVFAGIFDNIGIHTVLGYSGYYVLGYLLSTTDFRKKWKSLIYTIGLLGLVGTILGTCVLSSHFGRTIDLYGNSYPNVILWSIAVFVFFKEEVSRLNLSEKCSRHVRYLSKLTFGMYLTHIFSQMVVNKLFYITSFNPLFSVPLSAILIFIISFLVAFIIDHIPGVRKYII